jgi:lipoprotein-releasing system permease protein
VLSYFISRRYLFSKKSNNAINIITGIATVGIAVGTFALIMVLSVFNGLSGLLEDLFGAMDSDIKVLAASGKFFKNDEAVLSNIAQHPEVTNLTKSLEDRVVMQYYDQQAVVSIKGVDEDFTKNNPIDQPEFLWEGAYDFGEKSGVKQGIFGQGVAIQLALNIYDDNTPISIKALSPDARRISDLASAVRFERMFPSGIFSVQKEYDDKYVLTSIDFVEDLLSKKDQLTSIEISIRDRDKVAEVADELQASLGDTYRVLDWYEQHDSLYKVMRNEKYVAYLILSLLVAIAAINIVGSLSMIVLEKTRDVSVLKSMGTSAKQIYRIFLMEGVLVGGIGVLVGMILAFAFGFLQQEYGIIGMGNGAYFRVPAFPVKLVLSDFILVFVTVMGFTLLASLYPSRKASQINITEGLSM